MKTKRLYGFAAGGVVLAIAAFGQGVSQGNAAGQRRSGAGAQVSGRKGATPPNQGAAKRAEEAPPPIHKLQAELRLRAPLASQVSSQALLSALAFTDRFSKYGQRAADACIAEIYEAMRLDPVLATQYRESQKAAGTVGSMASLVAVQDYANYGETTRFCALAVLDPVGDDCSLAFITSVRPLEMDALFKMKPEIQMYVGRNSRSAAGWDSPTINLSMRPRSRPNAAPERSGFCLLRWNCRTLNGQWPATYSTGT